MCGFNPFKGGLSNPAMGDPITAKVMDKVTPKPIKAITAAPVKLLSKAIGKETTAGLLQAGINTPASKQQSKSLLGD
jgi:hypothetical protein